MISQAGNWNGAAGDTAGEAWGDSEVLNDKFPAMPDSTPMSKATSRTPSDAPEFVVRREVIGNYFDPPLATSTFHDLVNSGKIIPMKGMRGFYLLNASLHRLGLREVRELPRPTADRSLEDIVRLAFHIIDDELFPAPSWLLHVDGISSKDADHARTLADRHWDEVTSREHTPVKLAYFQGVLDWASMEESEVG